MADLSDATSGLASAVASVLFSSPYSFGASVASVLTWPLDDAAISTGAIIDLYPGWPAAEALTADLVAGHAHVSVFAEKDQTRDATRYQPQWRASPAVAPTLTAVLSGDVITFGGTASPRQVVGLLVDHGVSAGSYAYRCLATDTPASLAATLAAAIKGASGSENSLTVTGDSISVSIVCDQGATMELRRQIQGFRVSCWAPNPAARDIIAGAIDAALADMPWITLADGSAGRLLYRSTDYDDRISADRVWQRDLCYTIEYATQARQLQPVMLFPGTTINGSGTVMVPSSGSVLVGPAPIPGLTVSNAVLAVS
jgi:hypothetical protein